MYRDRFGGPLPENMHVAKLLADMVFCCAVHEIVTWNILDSALRELGFELPEEDIRELWQLSGTKPKYEENERPFPFELEKSKKLEPLLAKHYPSPTLGGSLSDLLRDILVSEGENAAHALRASTELWRYQMNDLLQNGIDEEFDPMD